MNTDIRIAVSFRGHRKRKRLRAMLGEDGTGYLLDLWISTALDRPDGVLHGMDDVDVALMAGWDGDPAVLVDALVSVGFLDRGEGGVYSLHDWATHNGYASTAAVRSAAARSAAKNRWARRYGSVGGDADVQPVDSAPDAGAGADRDDEAVPACISPAEVITLYNKILSVPPLSLPSVKVVSDRLKRSILARVREAADRRDAAWWERYFHDEVAASDFLCGRSGNGFRADLHWLVGPENMAKVLNGRYVNTNRSLPAKPARAPSSTRAGLDALKGGGRGSEGLGRGNGQGDAPGAGALELTKDADGRYAP